MSGVVREDAATRRSLVRWQWAGVVAFLLLVVAFPLYKAVEGPRRDDAEAALQAALLSQGRHLWGLNCAECHGVNGQGVDAPALNAKQFLQSVTDNQMHGVIAGGVPGSEMPAWLNEFGGPLTDQQIAALVAYVRSWEKTAPSRPDWRQPQGSMGSGSMGTG